MRTKPIVAITMPGGGRVRVYYSRTTDVAFWDGLVAIFGERARLAREYVEREKVAAGMPIVADETSADRSEET